MKIISKFTANSLFPPTCLLFLSFLLSIQCLAIDAKTVEEFQMPSSADHTQSGHLSPTEVSPAKVVHWKAINSLRYPDGSIVVYLKLTTENDFSIYATHLEFTSRSGYFLKKISPPPSKEVKDPVEGKIVSVYSGGDFILQFEGDESFDKSQFPLSIRYVACTVRICLFPYIEEMEIPTFNNTESLPNNLNASEILQAPSTHVIHPKSFGEEETFEEKLAERLQLGNLGLLMMLLALFVGGLLTNLTPCVYPMIPITIRLLASQTRKPIHASSAYAAGIVLIYSLLGLSVGFTGTLFGQYMANPYVNWALALVMFALGFSMLGFAKWAFLTRLGNKIGISEPGLGQCFLMGCGAGLVASPCTGPILASILTFIIANKELGRSTLYIFTYSLGFGLPYVALGALSGTFAKRKISPKVQVFVKVLFAAVMFALSLYYLRIPFYEVFSKWKHYWQSIFIITGLLGFILWRLLGFALNHRKLHWYMILPALLLGVSMFSGSRWIFEEQTEKVSNEHIVWYDNESDALAMSAKLGVPLLIDFWAEWCAACKKMDATTFSDAHFIEEAKKLNVLYLKVDVTQDTPANTKLLEKYKVQGLPTIVILKPGSEQPAVVSGYASAARLLNYFN